MFRPKGNRFKQKRKHFRLRYPKADRPFLHLIDGDYLVSEMSEKGMRILMRNISVLCQGMSVHGVVQLHKESEIDITGAILRFEGNEVILKLDKGPTLRVMEAEKVHLRHEYPLLVQNLKTIKRTKPIRKHSRR